MNEKLNCLKTIIFCSSYAACSTLYLTIMEKLGTNSPGYPDLIEYCYATMYTRAATTDMKEQVMSLFSKTGGRLRLICMSCYLKNHCKKFPIDQYSITVPFSNSIIKAMPQKCYVSTCKLCMWLCLGKLVLSPIHKYRRMVVLNIQGVVACQWWYLRVPNFHTFYNNVLPSRSSSEEVVNS